MNDDFKYGYEKYLVEKGFSSKSKSGNPSTVYDYVKRIEKIIKDESVDWNYLAKNIDKYVLEYDKGGIKEDIGRKSHNAVICSLKQFKKYIDSL